MMAPLRFAIVGCGYITQAEHVPGFLTLLPDVEVVATVDPVADRAARIAAPFKAAHYTDLSAALARPDVDAVFIATPAPTHVGLIETVAAAGKDILVEKPVAYDVAEARRSIAAVEAHGVHCMVGYHRRFDDDCLMVRKMLAEGAIGEVRAAVSDCRLAFPSIYRSYADVSGQKPQVQAQEIPSDWLAENSIHHLNLLRFWLGDVTTVHSAVYRSDNHNLGMLTLEFENKVLTAHHQLRGMECGEEITLYGSKGNLRVELWYPHRPYRFPRLTYFTLDPPGWREPAFARRSPYTNQIEYFARVVRGEAENHSTLHESVRDLEIIKDILDRASYLEPQGK